jgi:hypothetical protein
MRFLGYARLHYIPTMMNGELLWESSSLSRTSFFLFLVFSSSGMSNMEEQERWRGNVLSWDTHITLFLASNNIPRIAFHVTVCVIFESSVGRCPDGGAISFPETGCTSFLLVRCSRKQNDYRLISFFLFQILLGVFLFRILYRVLAWHDMTF